MLAVPARRQGSRLAVSALIALILVGLHHGPAAASTVDDEAQLRRMINHERIEASLARLSVGHRLTRVARQHSVEMSGTSRLYHNPELATDLRTVPFRIAGENVGVGGSIEVLHQAFMDSPPHRHNVLRQSFEKVGIGVVYGADGRLWVTVVFFG
jgi:uncharacterized protein YkwD